jgi:hypothetical protein
MLRQVLLLVSLKLEKISYKIRQACKSIDENLKRKSQPFFNIHTKILHKL